MFEKLLSWFRRKPDPEDDDHYMNIWGIIDGPYHRTETVCPGLPDDLEYLLLCKVEYMGEVFNRELWFGTMEEVDLLRDHFHNKIEPIRVNCDG